MKQLGGIGLIVTIILLAALVPQPALASSAQQVSTWSAAIAYFNPTDVDGELSVSYYPEEGSGFTPTFLTVNSHYSGTVLVGATPGTEGSAVLSSNFQMPAVYKIAGNSGDPYGVIMLEFFASEQIGTGEFYLPLVRKEAGGLTSRIGVQNIENDPIDVELSFIDSDGVETFSTTLPNIGPQYSEVFKTTDALFSDPETGLESGFDGSLVISATLDGSSPARIVAASADLSVLENRPAHSYQGAKTGSTEVHLPVVFCGYGREGLSTTLHIQNASNTTISQDAITADYYAGSAAPVLTNHALNPSGLSAGQRLEIDPCTPALEGQMLSAVINAPEDIVIVVETNNNQGLSSTSTSSASYCLSGACQIALPYVEWSSSTWSFQTSIYIMNTGSAAADITATYYRRDGSSQAQTFTDLPVNAMVASDPTQLPNLININRRDFKGAVLLQSDQPIMALVLVTRQFQNPDGSFLTRGDSYMGLEYTP